MANNDCKMARGLNIILGVFFGFVALGLFMIGITYLPLIGIFMGLISLVMAFLFLFAPKDSSCYMTR